MPALTRYLEKRVFDIRLYDVDMTDLLDDDETIASALSLSCDDGTVTFGPPVINPAPMLYPLIARRAEIGKVVQVLIGGGSLPYGSSESFASITVRVQTNINPQIEATVMMRLTGKR